MLFEDQEHDAGLGCHTALQQLGGLLRDPTCQGQEETIISSVVWQSGESLISAIFLIVIVLHFLNYHIELYLTWTFEIPI